MTFPSSSKKWYLFQTFNWLQKCPPPPQPFLMSTRVNGINKKTPPQPSSVRTFGELDKEVRCCPQLFSCLLKTPTNPCSSSSCYANFWDKVINFNMVGRIVYGGWVAFQFSEKKTKIYFFFVNKKVCLIRIKRVLLFVSFY